MLELLSSRTAALLNTSSLAQTLGLNRATVGHYLLLLERLFLVRRLAPWHRHAARRLVKTPKVHIVDAGLSAIMAGIEESDWLERRALMGHLLESFVVQQIITQRAGPIRTYRESVAVRRSGPGCPFPAEPLPHPIGS